VKSEYQVGDRIQISLNNPTLDVTIKAVVETTAGLSASRVR
jgi:ribosomal 50S subunit-recycling heat shock protein